MDRQIERRVANDSNHLFLSIHLSPGPFPFCPAGYHDASNCELQAYGTLPVFLT